MYLEAQNIFRNINESNSNLNKIMLEYPTRNSSIVCNCKIQRLFHVFRLVLLSASRTRRFKSLRFSHWR